jgi:hypothetical protein
MTLHQAQHRLVIAQKFQRAIKEKDAKREHVSPMLRKQIEDTTRECRSVIAEAKERAAGCDGKQKHASAHAADVALSNQRRHRRTGQHLSGLVTYPCRFCNSWHIGNVSTRRPGKAQKGTATAA